MSIRKPAIALIAALGLSACMSTTEQQQVLGGVIGGAAGVAGASLLDLGDGWVTVAGVAGATAGTIIARNRAQNQCAYADGRGGYTRGPC
jgi:osmotically inducible lipoprotein OsmB